MVTAKRLLFLAILVGCSARASQGVVAMKVTDKTAHVSLGNEAVSVGDKVAVFRNECSGVLSYKQRTPICNKRYIGEGTVTENLGEHYSVITVDSSVTILDGDVVEAR
jgi:hypothetical protein